MSSYNEYFLRQGSVYDLLCQDRIICGYLVHSKSGHTLDVAFLVHGPGINFHAQVMSPLHPLRMLVKYRVVVV